MTILDTKPNLKESENQVASNNRQLLFVIQVDNFWVPMSQYRFHLTFYLFGKTDISDCDGIFKKRHNLLGTRPKGRRSNATDSAAG